MSIRKTYAIGTETADLYTADDMNTVADAYLNEAGGEAIAKAVSPIKNRWSGQLRQAVMSKDKVKREELVAFRANVIGYRATRFGQATPLPLSSPA